MFMMFVLMSLLGGEQEGCIFAGTSKPGVEQ